MAHVFDVAYFTDQEEMDMLTRIQDAIAHMIEHELSAFYDITHGHGLAIIIPKWLTYIVKTRSTEHRE